MGTDIHAFVEYSDDLKGDPFSGRSGEPAWMFGRFSLSRDYALFDALGDGRNSQMGPEHAGPRSYYPPRGVPADLSLEVAWDYYDLVVADESPHPIFWPNHGCISIEQAEERVREGAHAGVVAQTMNYGGTPPRNWQAVAKVAWHTPSWLYVSEVHQSLNHHRLATTDMRWDFRVLLTCLSAMEEQLGSGNVRLVFWFDN